MAGTLVYVVDVAYSGEWVDDVWCAQVQVIGRRQDGRSVVVRVCGFRPYFYCNRKSAESSESDADRMQVAAERALDRIADGDTSPYKSMAKRARATDVNVTRTVKTPMMHYQGSRDMFKIELSHPHIVAKLRGEVISGNVASELTLLDGEEQVQTYESNVDFVLRFMVDCRVRCHAWIRVDSRAEEWFDDIGKTSFCASPDLCAATPDMISPITEEMETELGLTPSIHLLSFDIECSAPIHRFPDPELDPVIQIGCDWTVHDGRPSDEVSATMRTTMLALNKQPEDSTSAFEDLSTDQETTGADVDLKCFDNESDLLNYFAALIRFEDPDFITGWNTPNFDWWYIIERIKVLHLGDTAFQYSRLTEHRVRNRMNTQATKAHGHTEDNQVDIPGRVVFDMMTPIKVNAKLRSYKLDDVAFHYLKDRKDDVPHTEITKKWKGTAADRGVLAHYCVHDARLPRMLLLNRVMMLQYLEMARVCRVPTTYLVTRGQQIKVFTMILYYGGLNNFAVPFIPQTRDDGTHRAVSQQETTYEGATVVQPERGFYTTPTITLDFASLYPSIMLADNESHDTYLPGGKLPSEIRALPDTDPTRPELPVVDGKELSDDDVMKSPVGDIFIKASVRKGILPQILRSLLDARGRAKKEKAAAEERGDMHMHAVYDCRQLALKVSANSVYGFTGVQYGKLPCKAIARSVTSRGREMIETTTSVVIEHYEREFAPKYGGKARVIYGDTDSVFVVFPCSVPHGPDGKLTDVAAAVAEGFMFAKACSKAAAAVFPKPHDLEVEKAYYPFLLINKKRYAGGFFEYRRNRPPSSVPDKISTSGIEVVRRDNANMTPRQLQVVIDALMMDLDAERAFLYAQDSVAAIIHGPVPADRIAQGYVDHVVSTVVESLGGDDNADAARAGTLVDMAIAPVVMSNYTGEAAEINATPISPHSKVSEWQDHVAKILLQLGYDAVLQKVLRVTQRYMRLNLTPDDFVISKKYGRPFDLYENPQPHIEMLKRMEKRAERGGDEYAGQYRHYLGDRVNFIIVRPSAHYPKRITDRGEDPGWAHLHGVKHDPVYYLRQLLRPMARILKPLIGKKAAAYRRIMEIQVRTPRPEIGFTISAFDSKDAVYIWGRYASGKRKQQKSPAVLERNRRAELAKAHAAAASESRARGESPPPAPATTATRVTGPLDMFFAPT